MKRRVAHFLRRTANKLDPLGSRRMVTSDSTVDVVWQAQWKLHRASVAAAEARMAVGAARMALAGAERCLTKVQGK